MVGKEEQEEVEDKVEKEEKEMEGEEDVVEKEKKRGSGEGSASRHFPCRSL